MCLITWSSKGELLSKEKFSASYWRNDDGMGYMYREGDSVKAFKFVGPEEYVWKEYQKIEGIPHALHHRMATSGGKKLAMAHPFHVLSKARDGIDVYLMHNGVISGMSPTDKHSDTFVFVRDVLRPMLAKDPSLLDSHQFLWMLGSAVGSYNKLLIMTSKHDQPIIINASQGDKQGDFWFSNTYSLQPATNYHYPHNNRRANVQTTVLAPYCNTNGTIEKKTESTLTVSSLSRLSRTDLNDPKVLASAIAALDNFSNEDYKQLDNLNSQIIADIWELSWPSVG